MMDAGYRQTSKIEKELIKELKKEYSKASVELKQKMLKSMQGFEVEDKMKKAELAKGVITDKDYWKWRNGKLSNVKWMNSLSEEYARRISAINGQSIYSINDSCDKIYTLNVNAGAKEITATTGISFSQVSIETVQRLLDEKTVVLPAKMPKKISYSRKRLKQYKDIRWNMRKIKSELTQGILQGESIPKMARRIQKVTLANSKVATRAARTAVTSAQNGGRMDAYRRAERMGIKVDKQWVATHDSRTRKSHLDMDGEQVALNEEFSNGLMFPADPYGEPSEVYNCRCTMIPVTENGQEKGEESLDVVY